MEPAGVTTQSFLNDLLSKSVRVLLTTDVILEGTLIGWDVTAVFIQSGDAERRMMIGLTNIVWLESGEDAQPAMSEA